MEVEIQRMARQLKQFRQTLGLVDINSADRFATLVSSGLSTSGF